MDNTRPEHPYHFLTEAEEIDTGRYCLTVLVNWLLLAAEKARDEVKNGHLYCKGPEERPPRGASLLLGRATICRSCSVSHCIIE